MINNIQLKLVTILYSVCVFALTPNYLIACGWWGDGEINRSNRMTSLIARNKNLLTQSSVIQNTKVLGRMGYGLAIIEPGYAIPYLQAVKGNQVNQISELKMLGFKTVIDLNNNNKAVHLHRIETEALGMRYINIPIKGKLPSPIQLNNFTQQIVINASNAMLLIYAPNSALLGTMWAAYLINLGASIDFSVKQGKQFGMEAEQELILRKQ